MIAHLRLPFASLSCDDVIARGSGGQILALSQHVVLKCPTLFDNPASSQEAEMTESVERIEREKQVYSALRKRPHPHILLSPFSIPQGILLHRQAMNLDDRICQCPNNPLPAQVQERWIRQLSNALTWLEHLGLIHGDLRPANIFLTAHGNKGDVKLGDFDSTVRDGERLLVASEPFCKLLDNYKLPNGSHITDQFSLGSCIYTIRFQRIPWHDIDPPTRVIKLIRGELPETQSDTQFGGIISQCWIGCFASIRSVEDEIVRVLSNERGSQLVDRMLSSLENDLISMLNVESKEILSRTN
ncbi:unnamed protein product [Fusarium graminearum]|nr:unnamed protein product [Fusarium graminearum]